MVYLYIAHLAVIFAIEQLSYIIGEATIRFLYLHVLFPSFVYTAHDDSSYLRHCINYLGHFALSNLLVSKPAGKAGNLIIYPSIEP